MRVASSLTSNAAFFNCLNLAPAGKVALRLHVIVALMLDGFLGNHLVWYNYPSPSYASAGGFGPARPPSLSSMALR
jgi:hypothetical protein